MSTSDRIISDALALSPEDRLELIEKVWSSLAADSDALPVTDEQRWELDRRIAEMDSNPEAGIPWDDVKLQRRNPR